VLLSAAAVEVVREYKGAFAECPRFKDARADLEAHAAALVAESTGGLQRRCVNGSIPIGAAMLRLSIASLASPAMLASMQNGVAPVTLSQPSEACGSDTPVDSASATARGGSFDKLGLATEAPPVEDPSSVLDALQSAAFVVEAQVTSCITIPELYLSYFCRH
jgi:hypothetical protein